MKHFLEVLIFLTKGILLKKEKQASYNREEFLFGVSGTHLDTYLDGNEKHSWVLLFNFINSLKDFLMHSLCKFMCGKTFQ